MFSYLLIRCIEMNIYKTKFESNIKKDSNRELNENILHFAESKSYSNKAIKLYFTPIKFRYMQEKLCDA